MAKTAAAMYGGAAGLAFLEDAIPGGPELSLAPGLAALAVVVLLVTVGPRLPMPVLAALGPLGVALIGLALLTSPPSNDAALLYIWPTLWTAYFLGRTGSVLIVVWIALIHGVVVASLPEAVDNLDRWLDVVVSVGVVAAVVQALAERNRRLVARLEAEARVDTLTGVLNRRGFDERAQVELARATREQASLAAVSFDIDYFKRVNDEWGHETGDRVLMHLGGVLRATARAGDVVARLGGEEFVALLPGADLDSARTYAERVRSGFAAADELCRGHLTVSAGVTAAVAPETVESLLHAADTALYAAKRAGRDRAVAGGRADVEPLPSR